jgi:hypothetical protein
VLGEQALDPASQVGIGITGAVEKRPPVGAFGLVEGGDEDLELSHGRSPVAEVTPSVPAPLAHEPGGKDTWEGPRVGGGGERDTRTPERASVMSWNPGLEHHEGTLIRRRKVVEDLNFW